MSNPNLTDEQRQRRAETNRQNARKSTGPKSAAGKLAPRDRVEMGIVQRIIDAQWRLLRNSRSETLYFEDCLSQVSDLQHAGLPTEMLAAVDLVNATRLAFDSKHTAQFRKEEAALVRLITASLRELQLLRKLDPLPKSPITDRADILGPEMGPMDEIQILDNTKVVDSAGPSPATSYDRSQVITSWNLPPLPPKTLSATGNAYREAT